MEKSFTRDASETPSVEESNVLPERTGSSWQYRRKTPETGAVSAVELARAAQQAARPEPQEDRETKSAVDIAKEAQEIVHRKKRWQLRKKRRNLVRMI